MRRPLALALLTLLSLSCVLDLDQLQLAPDAAIAADASLDFADATLPFPDAGGVPDSATEISDASGLADIGLVPFDASSIPDTGTPPSDAAYPDTGPAQWLPLNLGLPGSAKILDLVPAWPSEPAAWVLVESSGTSYVLRCSYPAQTCASASVPARLRTITWPYANDSVVAAGEDSAIYLCTYSTSPSQVTCGPISVAPGSDAGSGVISVAALTQDTLLTLHEDQRLVRIDHLFDGGVPPLENQNGPAAPRFARGSIGELWVLTAAGALHQCSASTGQCPSTLISGVTGVTVVEDEVNRRPFVLISQGKNLSWLAWRTSTTWHSKSLESYLDEITAVYGATFEDVFVAGNKGGSAVVLHVRMWLNPEGGLVKSLTEPETSFPLNRLDGERCLWGFGADKVYIRETGAKCCRFDQTSCW